MFERIDHLGIAVADLEAEIAHYETLYSMPLTHRETVEEQGVEAVLFDVGENHVELLRPLSDDTPVGKFLARRGPGLHHIAYQVDDIHEALDTLRSHGVPILGDTARSGIRHSTVAFLDPKFTGGVLTEIVQPPEAH